MDDGSAARRYHEATKHSLASLQREPHRLDWANQPIPFKLYDPDPPLEALPAPGEPAGAAALAVLGGERADAAATPLDRATLARILFHALGIVRRRELPDGRTIGFRAAPCTGALYHVDAYVACASLPDLPAGVYQLGVHDFSLRRLRSGDHRAALGEGAERPVVAIALASTWWRNSWKYRARAYRHVGWDAGAIVAQLVAAAAACGVASRVEAAFPDEAVERLCDLDPEREGVAAIVHVGPSRPATPPPPAPPLGLAVRPLSGRERAWPEIRAVHDAGRLADAVEVAAWRARVPRLATPPHAAGALVELAAEAAASAEPLESVVRRRGSTRRFARRGISRTALASLLSAAAAPLDADFRAERERPLVDLFVIAHAVEGVPAGCYRRRPESGALERLSLGDRRRDAGFLALGQDLGADAAVNVYAIADLDALLPSLGSRGYRAAMLEGGISGGRAYLAAYAQGLGATGLTFFDDDVARLFGLDPARTAVAFLIAAGVTAGR